MKLLPAIEKSQTVALTALLLVTPSVAFAVTTPRTFKELVAMILHYISIVVPFIITLAVVYYMWIGLQGMRKSQEGKIDPDWPKTMAMGVLAIFLMVSIWGILQLLLSVFGVPVVQQ